jgi:hypothetical protein
MMAGAKVVFSRGAGAVLAIPAMPAVARAARAAPDLGPWGRRPAPPARAARSALLQSTLRGSTPPRTRPRSQAHLRRQQSTCRRPTAAGRSTTRQRVGLAAVVTTVERRRGAMAVATTAARAAVMTLGLARQSAPPARAARPLHRCTPRGPTPPRTRPRSPLTASRPRGMPPHPTAAGRPTTCQWAGGGGAVRVAVGVMVVAERAAPAAADLGPRGRRSTPPARAARPALLQSTLRGSTPPRTCPRSPPHQRRQRCTHHRPTAAGRSTTCQRVGLAAVVTTVEGGKAVGVMAATAAPGPEPRGRQSAPPARAARSALL